jgi:hypothetical protein
MKKLFFPLTLMLLISVVSCSSDGLKTVESDTFSLGLNPKMLAAEKGSLDEEGVLEYEDTISDLYLIVNRYKPGEPSILGESYSFTSLVEETVFVLSDKGKELATKEEKIDGLRAEVGDAVVETYEGSVFYVTGLIEGKNHLYRIVTWTGSASKDKNSQVMYDMIHSFQEK